MTRIFLWLASASVLLSLAAHPAFAAVGPLEAALAAALALLGLAGGSGLLLGRRPAAGGAGALYAAAGLYLAGFALSAGYAVATGVPPAAALRSALPYVVPFAAVAVWPLLGHRPSARALLLVVLAGAVAQSGYMLALFLQGSDFRSPLTLLMERITLKDPRTTLPLFLATAILPLALAVDAADRRVGAAAMALSAFGLVAAMTTLTRSHLIAVAIGYVGFVLLYAARRPDGPGAAPRWRAIAAGAGAAAIAAVAIVSVPQFRRLPEMVTLRTMVELYAEHERELVRRVMERIETQIEPGEAAELRRRLMAVGEPNLPMVTTILSEIRGRPAVDVVTATVEGLAKESEGAGSGEGGVGDPEVMRIAYAMTMSSGEQNLGGGRVHGEWIPALRTYAAATPLEWLIGIGAGRPFKAEGRMQTYIHNLPIYLLLYNGALGLLASAAFYALLAWALLRRWFVGGEAASLALVCLVAALGAYSLLFAVHKLIAFNLVVGLAFAAAVRPAGRAGPERAVQP
ncbi:MAG TPA: hypothetical protein VEH84_17530 [Alphaproteobacteria bacterium]|nr:hypothetical protein [Alphaproteobacteria bacterium]